jgi:putative ABC transport system permease protein
MLNDLLFRLRSLFSRESLEAAMNEELRFHFEQQVAKLRQSGITEEEARRRARLDFGGEDKIREDCREARGVSLVETLLQDLHYGARLLHKNPSFTAIAVLTLALGMGATTAIFSVIDAVLLRTLPYGDPGRLVIVWENNTRLSNPHNVVAPPNFLDWQNQATVFEGMAAMADTNANLTGSGDPEQVIVQNVSANFFSVIAVQPILGTGFTVENGKSGKDDVVVLDYGFWQERFGEDASIIGKTIQLNGKPQVVVGVTPRNFNLFIKDGTLTGRKPQMWSPWVFPKSFSDRKQVGRFLTVVARMKPGVKLAAAQDQMNTIADRLQQEYPDSNRNWAVNVVPLDRQLSGDLRPALITLFCAVGFVLLIACANVSSLLLARAAKREKEMAIRTAIGAGRWRIARQLLTESLLLALLGSALGLLLAVWGTNALLHASPKGLLDLRTISLDGRLFTFAAGMALLSTLLFGFLPSYIASHSFASAALKDEGRSASPGSRRRILRSTLVIAQMGLALVLLAGSGLLIRSFIRLIGVDPGFDPHDLLTFQVSLPTKKYPKDPAQMAFLQELQQRIGRLPGVRSVTQENYPPLSGMGAATGVYILGTPRQGASDLPVSGVRVVGPEYFRTMQIPIEAGRSFDPVEMAEPRHVVIANHTFVDKYLHGEDPIGKRLVIYMRDKGVDEKNPSEIIGVSGAVRQMGLGEEAKPNVYWPMPELVYSRMTFLVRTSRDPGSLTAAIRRELSEMDPQIPMASVTTMDELLSASLSRSRFTMWLLGLFATVALILTAVGVYGVIAYSVAQRTHEIGIRMALGARRTNVLALVLGQGTRLMLIGIGSGVVAALLLTRLMASLLYGVSAADPLTFASVALLLAAVSLLATYVPAQSATNVSPSVALRYDR